MRARAAVAVHVACAGHGAASGAGDVNGDGYADVIACSWMAGNVTVYHGGKDGLTPATLLTVPGEPTLGEGCITAGDVNGDGYADVVVSTAGAASAYVFYGSPSGVRVESPTRLAGVGGGGGFGDATAIATAGDVNGDGFADVLLGAYNGNSVLVFEGGPGGISPTPATVFGDLPDGGFGASVAAAGDVDGDGYGDIVFAPSQCSGFDV